MGYLIISYTIPAGERLRVGFKPLHSTGDFSYLSRYLYPTESPYSLQVPDGSYLIEVTAVKNECGGLCGDPQTYPAITQPNPTTTTTSTTTTSTSSTTSTTSTSTTTTTIVPSEVKWDIFSNDPGDPSEVTLTRTITITPGENYTVPTSTTSGLYYYVVKESALEPVKNKYYNTDINQGDIPDQVWLIPYLSGLYRYYVTNGLASFNESADTQLIHAV